MSPPIWILPALATFWIYELLEAMSHIAYAYNWQTKPKRIDDAFYFGTIKETLTNAIHLCLVFALGSLGVLSRLDGALLLLLVAMHLGFTVDGLRKGRARVALDHGYDHGLMPFRSPPLAGPYSIALLVKLFAHLDIALHCYFTVRLALLLPPPLVVGVLLAAAVAWRKVVVDGLLIRPGYNLIVYGSHAAALAIALRPG